MKYPSFLNYVFKALKKTTNNCFTYKYYNKLRKKTNN